MKNEQQERRMDWYSDSIIAALHQRKKALAAVSRKAGLSASILKNAPNLPWQKDQRIIANSPGIPANEIRQNIIPIRKRSILREMYNKKIR